jgi:hypothetical protein
MHTWDWIAYYYILRICLDRTTPWDTIEGNHCIGHLGPGLGNSLSRKDTHPKSRATSNLDTHPLMSRGTRSELLTVLPPKGSQELHCLLSHTPLDHPSEYHALSYAWRDDDLFTALDDNAPGDGMEEITTNNERLKVGRTWPQR